MLKNKMIILFLNILLFIFFLINNYFAFKENYFIFFISCLQTVIILFIVIINISDFFIKKDEIKKINIYKNLTSYNYLASILLPTNITIILFMFLLNNTQIILLNENWKIKLNYDFRYLKITEIAILIIFAINWFTNLIVLKTKGSMLEQEQILILNNFKKQWKVVVISYYGIIFIWLIIFFAFKIWKSRKLNNNNFILKK